MQISSPASPVVPSTVPRARTVSDQGRKLGVGGGPGKEQTLHTAQIWPGMEASCSGWIGILSWNGRWQVHAAQSAGACGGQCQQWLRVVGHNYSEGFQSPPLHCDCFALEVQRRELISSMVGYLELAYGHSFLSIYYAPDTVHKACTQHQEGGIFVVPMLQTREVSIREVVLVA